MIVCLVKSRMLEGSNINMCGIVGYTGHRKVAPILLTGLERLEYRGYDSAGISIIDNGKILTEKTIGRIQVLVSHTNGGENINGTIGIGHTRWATHGKPSDINAHPHLSENKKISVVHNGIIENYVELREFLISKGFKFNSETDTEVIPQLIEYFYKGDLLAAVSETVKMLRGSFGLGIICADEPEKLIGVKNSSPLVIGVGNNENFIASDITALVSHTKNVIYLDDGNIAVLSPDSVEVFDFDLNPVKHEISMVDWSIDTAEKGGYDHFMLKEIYEQPEAVKKTIAPRIKDGEIVLDGFNMTAEQLNNIDRIVITACGSACYAGQVGKYVIEELMRKPVEVDLASEFRYRNPIVNERTLMIVISQSGETADTIAAMKEAKSRGAHLLSIVNVVGSTIAKLSDDVLYTWAGPEIAVATTKGYTTQLVLLYAFAIYGAGIIGTIDSARRAELIDSLLKLPEQIQHTIDINKNINIIAEKYYSKHNIFFIGRNIDAAVALEGSLKLKEISYIHSEAYAAGELKHGTISLIEKGRLVIALACYERLFEKLLSNIKEVKARDATVLAVTNEGNNLILGEADDALFVAKTEPLFSASCEVIPLQLLAYNIAKLNGCDIDKPKNLAKSVTVE